MSPLTNLLVRLIKRKVVVPIVKIVLASKTQNSTVVTRNAPIVAVHPLNLRSELPEAALLMNQMLSQIEREGSVSLHLTVVKTRAMVLVIAKKDAEEIWLI